MDMYGTLQHICFSCDSHLSARYHAWFLHLSFPGVAWMELLECLPDANDSKGLSSFGNNITQSLKSCLLSCNPHLQLAACEVLQGMTSQATPHLSKQLLKADMCEFIFEVIRATLQDQQQQGRQQGTGRGSGGSQAQAALKVGGAQEMLQVQYNLQVCCLEVLRCLLLNYLGKARQSL